MAELLTTVNLRQFAFGFDLQLPFAINRVNSTAPYNDDEDTWEVRIIKPRGGGMMIKTDGLTFESDTEAKISVPIEALDFDRSGIYYYQVIKTTDGARIKSDVKEFPVLPSLPTGLPISPATSPLEGFFPFFNSQGAAVQSPLQYDAEDEILLLNGNPLGTGGGGGEVSNTAYGESWDGVNSVAPSKNAVYDQIEIIKTNYQLRSEKNAANGYAGLDGSSKLDPAQLPPTDWSAIENKPSTFAPSAHNHAASDINSGTINTARLGTGTADNTTFLRGDNTWQTVSSGSITSPFQLDAADAADNIFGIKAAASHSGKLLRIRNNSDVDLTWFSKNGDNNFGLFLHNTASNHTAYVRAEAYNGLGLASSDSVVSIMNSGLGYAGAYFYTNYDSATPQFNLTGNGDQIQMRIKPQAASTVDLIQFRTSGNTLISQFDKSASWHPPTIADSSAENNSIYYSSDAGKLVYKDSGGTVNNLY